MNSLFILIMFTFSNGSMIDTEVTGNVWKSKEDCLIEYKHMQQLAQHKESTQLACIPYSEH